MAKLPVQLPTNDQTPMVETPVEPMDNSQVSSDPTLGNRIYDRLLGMNGVDRYQLWPERMLRAGITAPHDVLNSKVPLTSEDLIKPALDMAALAGTGGVGGVGEEAGMALGSSPFLRPALKYEGKIYKAPVMKSGEFGQHLDAIPSNLRDEFTRQAMSGEDISNFNFGFMNHKSQFLNREDALKYAIDNGLLDPHAARYGALTSTMGLGQ